MTALGTDNDNTRATAALRIVGRVARCSTEHPRTPQDWCGLATVHRRVDASHLLSMIDDLAALAGIIGDLVGRAAWLEVATRLGQRHGASDQQLLVLDDSLAPPLAALAADKMGILRQGGRIARERAIAELPADLRWLLESHAITIVQLERLTRALDSVTLADLVMATSLGWVRRVEGLGPDVEEAIARALPSLRASVPPLPLGRALDAAEPTLARLRACAAVEWALPAGSLRRGHDLVGDIEIVVAAEAPGSVLDDLTSAPEVEQLLYRSPGRVSVLVDQTQVNVRCPPLEHAATTLLYLTGSGGHIEGLRDRARSRGLTLGRNGLVDNQGRRRRAGSEHDIYQSLGLPYIAPELRRGDSEIERASVGTLPDLVDRDDILGDLHMHTQWSDGGDTTQEMVRAAAALGYRYIAITDHSPRSAASRNLSVDDVPRQAEEIATLREQYPKMTILHGCEVDILADGTLDFPDRTLRRFDIVLASLHDRANHSPQQLLRRYLSAMLHPLVTILTHPANRLFPHRPGYELDYGRLFEAAVETRTILEIDGAPSHIDLDATLAARAVNAGVTVCINSDAHAADRLGRHMQIALLTARRAAVEPRHVLNTRPLPEIRAIIAAKRARGPS